MDVVQISASAERRLERALEQLQQLEAGVCLLEGKVCEHKTWMELHMYNTHYSQPR